MPLYRRDICSFRVLDLLLMLSLHALLSLPLYLLNTYLIEKDKAELFMRLLDKHKISYQHLTESKKFNVGRCKLIKIEDLQVQFWILRLL